MEENINVLGCPCWGGNWLHVLVEFDKPVGKWFTLTPECLHRSRFADKTIKRIRYVVLGLAQQTKADPWAENVTPTATQNIGTFLCHVCVACVAMGSADIWGPQRVWAPIRPPTQLHRFHKSTGRETWWAAPFQRGHFQGPKNVRKRLSQECCGPSSASGIHTKPLAWPHLKPGRAQGLLSSPKTEDWSLEARSAQSRSRGNVQMVAEPHKVLSEVNIKHCEHREGGAMDSM